MSRDQDGPRLDPDDHPPPSPVSFRIIVGLAVLYLGWRLVEGIMWIVERLT